MSETRISEKPGCVPSLSDGLGRQSTQCWRPHGARPGWGSEATGRQARVKSAAGQASPPAAQRDAAECSEPVCVLRPGGPRPASSVVSAGSVF